MPEDVVRAWGRGMRRLLTAVTFVISFAFAYGPAALRMTFPGALAVSAAAAAAVWLSGSRPVAGLAFGAALAVALPASGSTFEALPVVLVFVAFQATMRSELRPVVLAIVCLGSMTVNEVWQRHAFGRSFAEPSVLYPVLMSALAVGLGLQSRRVRRQHVELIRLQDADRRRALSDERRLIARDIHDIAAHHLSALVVRNKLARRIGTVEALTEAADFTADTAGAALDSLRQVVHVLNAEQRAPLDPQPSFAHMDELVARMERAGLRVERSGGAPPPAPRTVQVAAVRIVQEALANVLRHRGPGCVWLDLRGDDEKMELTIDDDGPATWSPGMTDSIWQRPGGYGMIGMRERAEGCGGRLTVGPSPRGGWRVAAVLPGPLGPTEAR